MIPPEHQAAIDRGVENLISFLNREEYFRKHWADFIAEFTNIARTAADEALAG